MQLPNGRARIQTGLYLAPGVHILAILPFDLIVTLECVPLSQCQHCGLLSLPELTSSSVSQGLETLAAYGVVAKSRSNRVTYVQGQCLAF